MPPRGVVLAARWLLIGAFLVLLGCSGRRVPMPAISADKAGQEALAQYDSNKDGVLDADELKRSPALSSGVKALDKNKDGRISAEEIAERIKAYQASQVGLMGLVVQVTLDGKPLAGATVTLVPEKFLGDAIKPASGVSDARGTVQIRTEGAEVPGAACGWFRVEVSKKDSTGRETLPSRYNQTTTLGLEVAPDGQQGIRRFALRGS